MTPLAELPTPSSEGDQRANPTTFGTTTMMTPLTPDLAGRPTWAMALAIGWRQQMWVVC